MDRPPFPEGLEHVRTTAVFDNETVPAGLLRAHHVAAGVWGRLVVHTGEVDFVFEDDAENPHTVHAGETMTIPPERKHHVELRGHATFAVEFHREPKERQPQSGHESTGLSGGDDPDR